ncbi:hypothetical protein [Anaeroselena agilis]|uniref:Uncharacterized protein n=1 Tax=Anaeroselena agilis TaxID=3063788 RepID=A0ABU3NUZ8_9FIRM|nr:hypothetical protein [Selenomonadales bacterium 4137-cl]
MHLAKASVKATKGILNSPADFFIGSFRLAQGSQEIKITEPLDIPEGGVAILRLVPFLAKKSNLRLVNEVIPAGEKPVLYIDNVGVDAYRITKGTPLVEYFIVAGTPEKQ